MIRRFLPAWAVALAIAAVLWGAWEFLFSYHSERLRARGDKIAAEILAKKIVGKYGEDIREEMLASGVTPDEAEEAMAQLRGLAAAVQRGVDTGADPELIKVAIQEFLAKLDAIDRETIRAAMPEQEP